MLEDERGLWDTAIIWAIAAVYIVRKPGLRISEVDVTNPQPKTEIYKESIHQSWFVWPPGLRSHKMLCRTPSRINTNRSIVFRV